MAEHQLPKLIATVSDHSLARWFSLGETRIRPSQVTFGMVIGTGLTGYLVLDRGVGGDARSSAVGEVGIGPGADDTGGPTSRAAPAGQRDLEDPVGRPEAASSAGPPTNTVYMSLSTPGRDGGCSRE